MMHGAMLQGGRWFLYRDFASSRMGSATATRRVILNQRNSTRGRNERIGRTKMSHGKLAFFLTIAPCGFAAVRAETNSRLNRPRRPPTATTPTACAWPESC